MTDHLLAKWLDQYKNEVSERDFTLLRRAGETLLGNIINTSPTPEQMTAVGATKDPSAPQPWAPYRGIAPSPFRYRGVWNWDSAFHAIGTSRWDIDLAREQITIIMGIQQPDGTIPDCILENGTLINDFGKPPVMPWACSIVDKRCPNDEFLAMLYEKFIVYEGHWRKNRGGDLRGLFNYDSTTQDESKKHQDVCYETGWDNSVRWDNGCRELWCIDLNCYMVMLYRAMVYMASRLGRTEDIDKWQEREKSLIELINEKLWNPEAEAYMDFNYKKGEFNNVLSPASFMPLYTRIAPDDRAAKMAEIAADPNKFFPGMPAVSYDDPEYSSTHFWRGPTWINITYFALKGLYNYGFDKLAEDFRQNILDWCAKNEDSLYEYYDSKTGLGVGCKQYGWTATFVMEFILNWNKENDL